MYMTSHKEEAEKENGPVERCVLSHRCTAFLLSASEFSMAISHRFLHIASIAHAAVYEQRSPVAVFNYDTPYSSRGE